MKKELVEAVFVKPVPLTGNVTLNIDALEKIWDHRCVIYKNKDYKHNSTEADTYRYVRFARRGSPVCSKVTISAEQALEIIKRLELVESSGFINSSSSFRKEGFSEFDLISKKHKTR